MCPYSVSKGNGDMNGRAYVQKGDKCGWIKERNPHEILPKIARDVELTSDVTKSLVLDVDNPSGFQLLNSLLEDGYLVVIGDTYIHKKVVAPSASPFSPLT